MVSQIKAICVDLDTLRAVGCQMLQTQISIACTDPTWACKQPALWCWIPEETCDEASARDAERFVEKNRKAIGNVIIGPLGTGRLMPHQVLVFSRSVHLIAPIRAAELAQTVVGDDLSVLGNHRHKFSSDFSVELSAEQSAFLQYRLKSVLFDYLRAGCSVSELNASMWCQERCEGAAILGSSHGRYMLVTTSKETLKEWHKIIKQELSQVPTTPMPRHESNEVLQEKFGASGTSSRACFRHFSHRPQPPTAAELRQQQEEASHPSGAKEAGESWNELLEAPSAPEPPLTAKLEELRESAKEAMAEEEARTRAELAAAPRKLSHAQLQAHENFVRIQTLDRRSQDDLGPLRNNVRNGSDDSALLNALNAMRSEVLGKNTGSDQIGEEWRCSQKLGRAISLPAEDSITLDSVGGSQKLGRRVSLPVEDSNALDSVRVLDSVSGRPVSLPVADSGVAVSRSVRFA